MARSLAGCRMNARTPISVEREFSLFGPDARPARRATTDRFMSRLRSRLVSGRYELVEEVAGNSFELKVCFSSPAQIREDLRRAYVEIIRQAQVDGLLVSGISSPVHAEEFNSFFTTMAFPKGKRFIGRTNSIHIHFSGRREGELINRYNAGNVLAPLILDISQSSVIDGQERGRAVQISRFLDSIPPELANPALVDGFEGFEAALERARQAAQNEIAHSLNGAIGELCRRYPDFAGVNGHGFELLRLTPDKMFSLARLRPDKRSDPLGLAGSVEIRSIDGQATLEQDLAMIELTIGLLVFAENSACVLGQREIAGIDSAIRSAAALPLHTDAPRAALALSAINNAEQGLRSIDMEAEFLEAARALVARPGYLEYSGMADEEIIRRSARQFIRGVN